MKNIESTRVFTFHYTLTSDQGETIDSSREANNPMIFLEGAGQIIPGLEKVIGLLNSGDKKTVQVDAKDAYGEFDQKLIMTVPRDRFPKDADIKEGDQFRAGSAHEPGPIFTVKSISTVEVTLDGNHPLAGQSLTFDIEIVSIRNATADELKHGHAHGPNGHHHH